jgi:hypothetical protein
LRFSRGVPSIAAAVALAFAAPAANASNPVTQGYSEDHGIVQQVNSASPGGTAAGKVQSAASHANSNGSGASLPFTGLDIAIVLALGAVLAGTGVVLRRAAGGRDTTA